MSRCFPFPPPGYIRKSKTDDTDLLKKEKHKEKKHKKEKKDKEKKEGKEKREKDRSDEKHRERKDKKEKHRDKRKDKDKDRDKDKHKSDLLLSEKKKAVGSIENHVHELPEKNKEREIDKNDTSAEKRIGGLSGVHNGMPFGKNSPQFNETKSYKHIPDMGRKTFDGERTMPNQLSDKNVGTDRKKDEGVIMAAKGGGPLQESKERTKEKPVFVIGDARSAGSGLVSTSVGLVPTAGAFQNRVGGNRHLEKKIEQQVDGKEKVRETEWEDRKGDRRKEKDREKPILKAKDKEKEETMKATTFEEKHIQMTRMKDGGENMLKSTVKDTNKDMSAVQSAGFHNIAKDNNHHVAKVNNIRKRKEPGINGTYDELVIGPNKLARRTVSHVLTENGRSLEPCQISSAFAPGTQPMNIKVDPKLSHVDSTQKPPMRIKVDGKECKINGKIPESFTQSSRETVSKGERKPTDAPAKLPPPHPDTKYLSQVLSVPKMNEWSDFDDQEWLFDSSSFSPTRKQEVKLSSTNEMPRPQVWAQGIWLEPVDVFALPYVIPH